MERMQIDTGGADFRTIRDEGMYYVDKSMLIADILGNGRLGVYLFTRPRRFGKTTNLTMLDAFFNMRYSKEDSDRWFGGLEISRHPEYDRYRNAFPVVYLNLMGTESDGLPDYASRFRKAVVAAFDLHPGIGDWEGLLSEERRVFGDLYANRISDADLQTSVTHLCNALTRMHGRKPVILIDEYDRAVSDAYGSGSHSRMMDFLGRFLASALKENENRQLAVVTGVLEAAKKGAFSGFNNADVNNIYSPISDERFGFTEEEVAGILEYYGRSDRRAEAMEWYDGYRFGNAEVYNPFSVMRYVQRGCVPDTYWADAGGDVILRQLYSKMNSSSFGTILELSLGGAAEVSLYRSIKYEDMDGELKTVLSLMAISGYLKAVPAGDGRFRVSIPNGEIRSILGDTLSRVTNLDTSDTEVFCMAVRSGDPEAMAEALENALAGQDNLILTDESHYQNVVVDLLRPLNRFYRISSERGGGNGRIDILLEARREGEPNAAMELKRAGSEKRLPAEARAGTDQIHRRMYYSRLPGTTRIYGIAFFGRFAKVVRDGDVTDGRRPEGRTGPGPVRIVFVRRRRWGPPCWTCPRTPSSWTAPRRRITRRPPG